MKQRKSFKLVLSVHSRVYSVLLRSLRLVFSSTALYKVQMLGYQIWLLSPLTLLPPQGCRSVEEFQCLNRIEEGTYGVVYRAKDKKTGR